MPNWRIEVEHKGLNRSRIITGNDQAVVERKALEQRLLWEKEWLADVSSREARTAIELVQTVLSRTLAQNGYIDWDGLKVGTDYSVPPPALADSISIPLEPKSTDWAFRLNWWDRDRFRRAHNEWQQMKAFADAAQAAHKNNIKRWEDDRKRFIDAARAVNQSRDEDKVAFEAAKEAYLSGDIPRTVNYIAGILKFFVLQAERRSERALTRTINLSFKTAQQALILDVDLPRLEILPTLKEVRFIKTKDRFDKILMRSNEVNALYNSLVLQICLRTIYLVYAFDTKKFVKSVVFNGWADFVDKATGKDARACIISLMADQEAFLALDLSRADPKACFQILKGVGSSELYGMTPVAPIMRGTQNDPRFVESMAVASHLREGTNLAAIGWEDFEHLIRELFEKEYVRIGAKVNVTQASHDGGVDVVVSDPDPIRGGKIVIQAKRYTNPVDVSAVRELYGTVINEGAMKGILVTTSSFGPDSYSFARDKPITLLDGSNLMHMLAEHGHRAYIDLAEAKRLNPAPLARTVSYEQRSTIASTTTETDSKI